MLAHDIAQRFEEWLAEQERPRPWSLQEALLAWVKDKSPYWTNGSYELHLRSVVIILANWIVEQSKYSYQLNGEEAVLDELYAEAITRGLLVRPPGSASSATCTSTPSSCGRRGKP